LTTCAPLFRSTPAVDKGLELTDTTNATIWRLSEFRNESEAHFKILLSFGGSGMLTKVNIDQLTGKNGDSM